MPFALFVIEYVVQIVIVFVGFSYSYLFYPEHRHEIFGSETDYYYLHKLIVLVPLASVPISGEMQREPYIQQGLYCK